MDERVDAGHRPLDVVRLADVARDELGAGRWIRLRRAQVEQPHLVPPLDEYRRERHGQRTGAACDQDRRSHVAYPSWVA
jgi:hypothetical protein